MPRETLIINFEKISVKMCRGSEAPVAPRLIGFLALLYTLAIARAYPTTPGDNHGEIIGGLERSQDGGLTQSTPSNLNTTALGSSTETKIENLGLNFKQNDDHNRSHMGKLSSSAFYMVPGPKTDRPVAPGGKLQTADEYDEYPDYPSYETSSQGPTVSTLTTTLKSDVNSAVDGLNSKPVKTTRPQGFGDLDPLQDYFQYEDYSPELKELPEVDETGVTVVPPAVLNTTEKVPLIDLTIVVTAEAVNPTEPSQGWPLITSVVVHFYRVARNRKEECYGIVRALILTILELFQL